MRIFYTVLGVIILVLGVLLAAKNATLVSFNYYFGQKELPLILLLTGFFIIGILLGFMISFYQTLRLKIELHRHKKKVIQLTDEISELRLSSIQGNR